MTKFLTLLIAFLFFATSAKGQEKEWTLLVYVIGTDIVSDAITDIGEMKAAGKTDNVNIIGMLGGSKLEDWKTPSVSLFEDGIEYTLDYTPIDSKMVSVANLTQFIDYGVKNYPAKKYMVAFYNHGMSIRGWGWDETTDTQFRVNDLKAGIENTQYVKNGNKFDLLAFDACLMANLEAQYALKDVANYFIASEEEEPWHAWNWTPIITAMNSQSNLTVPQLGKIIVDGFLKQAEDKKTHGITLSLVDLSKLQGLVTSIENVLQGLDNNTHLESLFQARAISEEYGKSISDPSTSEDVVDIGDMFKHLKNQEPSFSTLIDNVLHNLDSAVVYERSDSTRPQATGITMYLPQNQFYNYDQLHSVADSIYGKLPFSTTIKNFVINKYMPYLIEDNEPVKGEIDHSQGLISGGSTGGVLGQKYTSIRIDESHLNQLHQLQVVLMEEIENDPEEYILLGSTVPDTVITNTDNSKIFSYQWDEEWLSVNGFPAYVADIQSFDVLDSEGSISHTFTRIHIPAILNPNSANPKKIVLDFKYDENFNFELEGIDREPYKSPSGSVVTSKDRIHLKSGDEVQLVYEIFNAKTHEGMFVPEPNAIINIENGNEDLVLGHDKLSAGKYHIGFVLMDHAHNDTVIYDPMLREITTTSTNEALIEDLNEVVIFPSPSSGIVQLDFPKIVNGVLNIYDSKGQLILSSNVTQQSTMKIDLTGNTAGVYFYSISSTGDLKQYDGSFVIE
jgi:cysteine peptidase C11 family protein/type IX secretion system substrate protein